MADVGGTVDTRWAFGDAARARARSAAREILKSGHSCAVEALPASGGVWEPVLLALRSATADDVIRGLEDTISARPSEPVRIRPYSSSSLAPVAGGAPVVCYQPD